MIMVIIMMKKSNDNLRPMLSEASDPEDEVYPAHFAKISWALSQGKAGHLHLGSCGDFSCGRRLRMPEVGQGLSEALATGKQWSPRCYKALPNAAKAWWVDSF